MSESYGYNHQDSLENYLTADELIQMFVRIVAKGGNLNLMVNPDGTGKVPDIQMDLLKELGDWLKVNGEAIYGTRPYEVICDNTQLGQPVWYTMSKDSTYGYAIVFEWPAVLDAGVAVSGRGSLSTAAADPDVLIPTTRRRLCLPADRDDEIAAWLAEHPPPFVEHVATVRWPGAAEPAA